jgi:hypothetical protein
MFANVQNRKVVVFCGGETWTVAFREEHTLRVFEKRVLRIFGLKRDEVMVEWRKLLNDKCLTGNAASMGFHNLRNFLTGCMTLSKNRLTVSPYLCVCPP